MIDRNNVAEVLRRHIESKYETQREAAKALHICPSTLCHMLAGRRLPCGSLLQDAGLVRRTVYEQRSAG